MELKDLTFHKVFEKAFDNTLGSIDINVVEKNFLIKLKNDRINKKGLIDSFEEQSLSLACFEKKFNLSVSDLLRDIKNFDLIKEINEVLKEPSQFQYIFEQEITEELKSLLELRKGSLKKDQLYEILTKKRRMDYIEGVLIKDIDMDMDDLGVNQSYSFCIFENCTFKKGIYFDNIEHCVFKNCQFPQSAHFETGTSVDIYFEYCNLNEMSFYDFYVDFLSFDNCHLKNIFLPNAFEEISFLDCKIENSFFAKNNSLCDLYFENSQHDLNLREINKEIFYMMYKDTKKFNYLKSDDIYHVAIGENDFIAEQKSVADNSWRYYRIEDNDLTSILQMLN